MVDDILPNVEKFVCALYGQNDSAGFNAARYNLFRLTCRSEALPSNQDCLKSHIAMVNYQIAIHRHSRFIDAPLAVEHGWKVEDGQLVYKWMDNSPASQSVLKSINCKCKKSGYKGTCSCLKGGLSCTDYCQCVRELYANWPSHEVVGSGSGYDTDSGDSDIVYGQMSDLFIGKSQKPYICNIFVGKLPQKLMCNIFLLFGVG